MTWRQRRRRAGAHAPRDASAAMALVTAATEPLRTRASSRVRRRSRRGDGLTPLAISPRQRLDDACATVDGLPFGGTDCALPMLYALERRA